MSPALLRRRLISCTAFGLNSVVMTPPEEIHHHDVVHFALNELRQELGGPDREHPKNPPPSSRNQGKARAARIEYGVCWPSGATFEICSGVSVVDLN